MKHIVLASLLLSISSMATAQLPSACEVKCRKIEGYDTISENKNSNLRSDMTLLNKDGHYCSRVKVLMIGTLDGGQVPAKAILKDNVFTKWTTLGFIDTQTCEIPDEIKDFAYTSSELAEVLEEQNNHHKCEVNRFYEDPKTNLLKTQNLARYSDNFFEYSSQELVLEDKDGEVRKVKPISGINKKPNAKKLAEQRHRELVKAGVCE